MTYNGWYAIKPNQTKPNPIYLIYMYKKDLALNDLQWLICHKTKPNQTNSYECDRNPAKMALHNEIFIRAIYSVIFNWMIL